MNYRTGVSYQTTRFEQTPNRLRMMLCDGLGFNKALDAGSLNLANILFVCSFRLIVEWILLQAHTNALARERTK